MNQTPGTGPWPGGARAAVALTYDDAMDSHLDLVAPALESHGLRGTFYTPIREGLMNHAQRWRALAERGHELGNHTIFHPCYRENPAPDCPNKPWNNLINFDEDRLRNELRVANLVLRLIDGQTERTYGNTCHNVFIGLGENKRRIEPVLAPMFPGGRGECRNQIGDPFTTDLLCLGTIQGDGKGFNEWRTWLDEAVAAGGFAVLTFHSVGPERQRLQVEEAEHRKLLQYLEDQRAEIWTAPVIEIVRWIRDQIRPSAAAEINSPWLEPLIYP